MLTAPIDSLDFRGARRQLRPQHSRVEPGRCPRHSTAGLLVCLWHDNTVRVFSFVRSATITECTRCYSILIPWFSVREVPVDIEVVSISRQRGHSAFMEQASSAAVSEGGNLAFRARHAARSSYADISVLDHGVPLVRYRLVS